MKISIIAAVSQNNVIGIKGKLPWHIPQDLKRFKAITMGHCVLMGQNTFNSISKPLPGRTNIILSFDKKFKVKGCFVFQEIKSALEFAKQKGEEELMIIGGGQIYKLMFPLAQKIYLTKILKNYDGDVFFPKINERQWRQKVIEKHTDSNPAYEILVLERKFPRLYPSPQI